MATHPDFDAAFRAEFRDLVLWRRDVRRFRSDPVARERIDALLEVASHAPSVGLSQPWRFVHVESVERRRAVVGSFTQANEQALAGYAGEKHAIYAGLKLAGSDRYRATRWLCTSTRLARPVVPRRLACPIGRSSVQRRCGRRSGMSRHFVQSIICRSIMWEALAISLAPRS